MQQYFHEIYSARKLKVGKIVEASVAVTDFVYGFFGKRDRGRYVRL